MAVDFEDNMANTSRLWVFGYGSILWKTGFEYQSKRVGNIEGYERRFWQGNSTHRGTWDSPGRVATLVKSPDSKLKAKVWGVAYELVGAQMIRRALEHLGVRECALGGYCHMTVPFFSQDCCPFQVLVFTATEDNAQFLGPAPLDDIAHQVTMCRGNAGHNVEYVLRLAQYVRQHLTEDNDPHLFTLESLILKKLNQKNICPERLIQEHLPDHQVHQTKRKDSVVNSTSKLVLQAHA